ncbi:hypothetical protein IGK25_001628 [Enterococcus sp. DIV1614a]
MNDKIQKLIKKLAKECQKEDVGLLVCIRIWRNK